MCGITGIYNFRSKRPVNRIQLQSMCDSIAHRGPDAEGVYFDDSCGLGFAHRRLSIIDIAGSPQPMASADKNLWIIFNGEIYNYKMLRKDLEQKGYRFSTSGDTEVVIYLYQEYGEKAFEKMNGIFAYALYDVKQKTVVLVRDHFGIKPLYYSLTNEGIIFGSEIKSIIKNKSFRREIDIDALNTFFTLRYNPSPQTLFRNIHKLSPGHYLKITPDGNTLINNYWEYVPRTQAKISETEAIEEYARILEESVERQMTSDVPVGLLLSGGIDSAIIGLLMKKYSSEKIKTFTIGFPGEGDYNELNDAATTAAFIGSEHFPLEINQQEYLDFFFKSFYYTEEPIAEPTIPALYYVSKLASQHLKVVLAGQGADEPLAGYKRYFGEKYLTQFSWLLQYFPLETISSLIPRNERLKRAAYANNFLNEVERFLAIYTIFTPSQKQKLFLPDLYNANINIEKSIIEKLYANTGQITDSLSKLLYIDTRMYLSDDLLIFGDKMTMANSLEMRVPFLDIELVKFLESLPAHFKLRGKTHKWIHKKALERYLPKEIVYRKKRGFATPVDIWLQKDLGKSMRERINASDSASRMFFDVSTINAMLDAHQAKRENYQRHIFALLSFEIWYKTFFQAYDM